MDYKYSYLTYLQPFLFSEFIQLEFLQLCSLREAVLFLYKLRANHGFRGRRMFVQP